MKFKIERKYLPSKKFISSLCIAIFLVLIVIAINYVESNKSAYKNDLVVDSSSTLFNTIDTDHDGLPDWQESLYGTDPKKADTDGDGTSDGEEVKENRDPLKANTAKSGEEPNDKISADVVEKNQQIADDYAKLSATEKLARELISNIIASVPANGSLDQATIDDLVNKSIQNIPNKNFTGITQMTDLNLITITKNNFIKNFGTYLTSYTKQTNAFRKLIGQDITIIDDFITTKDSADQKKISAITTKYQAIVDSLTKTTVPSFSDSGIVSYHLGIINDLEKLIQIDNDIINSGKDIAGIYSDLAAYNDTLTDLLSKLDTIDTIFNIKRS